MSKEIEVSFEVPNWWVNKRIPNGPAWYPLIDHKVVDTIPSSSHLSVGNQVRYMLFNTGRELKPNEVDLERKKLGLVQDIPALMLYNDLNKDFCKHRSVGDSWQGPDGRWYYIYLKQRLNAHLNMMGHIFGGKCDGTSWSSEAWFGGLIVT